jgi:5-formyltetrahydrofolate cyclo-ligase
VTSATIISIKQTLRREARERLRAISPEAHTELSRRACELFLAHAKLDSHTSLLLYMPLQGELDVRLILAEATARKRQIALPRFLPDQGKYAAFFIGDKPLAPGAFGALEPDESMPVPLNQLDLLLVPGLGFDLRGRRLGRGKGFYDRMLSEASGVKCGICFDEQILQEIPAEPHDISVDFLATPTRWLDCRGSTPEVQ